jgi:3-hydroxy-9,10-secoandrosta-1,3,5(10)-triene-9,17-dione monooxygenase reductase component
MQSDNEAKDSASFEAGALRQALGSFATGVTILTTRAPDGEPLGLTINSFNSVSLDPPLVLWSLSKNAHSLSVFRDTGYWAVHVLSSDQAELSSRFARQGEDKFAGLDIENGVNDMPMLQNCTARFQCKTEFQYEGGDHVIFIGKILSFDQNEKAPLVFHGGRYAHATRRDNQRNPRRPHLVGSFNENFLGYLLGRSHFRFYDHIRELLESERLSDEEFYVLSTLTLKRRMTTAELEAGMAGVLEEQSRKALASLIKRGMVLQEDNAEGISIVQLTAQGSQCALRLISAAKAVESEVLEHFGYEESAVLKSLLNRLLDSIDPHAGVLWGNPEE